MNAAEKAWQKRKRLSNHDLLGRYMKRKTAVVEKIDKAILRVLRANAYLFRVRNESKRILHQMGQLSASIQRGEVYPPKKEKKKKGRRIEL